MKGIIFKYLIAAFFILLLIPDNIQAREAIRVSLSKNPPLVFTDDSGNAAGIYVDIIKHIAKEEDWEIEFVPCKWRECLRNLETGKIDLLMSVAYSEERAGKFDFTKEVVFNNWAVVYRKPLTQIESLKDLEGERVALLKGNIHSRAFVDLIGSFGINCEIVEVDDYADIFKSIDEGKATAGVVNRVNGIKFENQYEAEKTTVIFNPVKLYFATPKGKDPELRASIDMHLRKVKANSKSIYYLSLNRWLSGVRDRLVFEPASHSDERPIVFAGHKDIPPVESLEHGYPVGMNVQILQALAEAMGRRVEIRLMKWSEAQEQVLNGQADALTLFGPTKKRKELYDFTDRIFGFEFTLFFRSDDITVHSLKDMEGRVVGVTKGGYPWQVIEANRKIKLRFIDSYQEGFKLLEEKKIDAVSMDKWVGQYIIQKYGIKGIGMLDKPFSVINTSIAVKKGNAVLLSQINLGVRKLRRDGTIKRITGEWSAKEVIYITKEKINKYKLIGIIISVLILFSGLILWTLALRRQVKKKTSELQGASDALEVKVIERTKELHNELAERRKAEEALRTSEQQLRQLVENSPIAMSIIKTDGTIEYINKNHIAVAGYSLADIPTIEHWWKSSIPDEEKRNEVIERWKLYLEESGRGEDIGVQERTIVCKDGSIKEVELQYTRLDERIIVVFNDITERKLAEEERTTLLHEMGERVKELRCLYGVAESVHKRNTINEIFDDVISLIPSGWHYPDITRGRIRFDGQGYVSEPFQETGWKQASNIIINGKHRGMVEVYYLEERPELYEGPFLKEERDLIDGIARTLSEAIERKEAEEALREREAFISTIMDNLHIGIAVNSVDPTVNFEYMNDNFPRFYRTTKEKLADPDAFWNAVYEDPEFREEIKKRMLDDCASGDPKRMNWVDVPITRKGSETTYITARSIPVPHKQLMISTVFDVTERKKAEEALRTSEERFRDLAETLPLTIFEIDLRGRLTYVNRAALDVFGYSQEDVETGVSVMQVIAPEDRERVQEAIACRLNVEQDKYKEYLGLRKDGTTFPIMVFTNPIVREGRTVGLSGIVSDITDRKLLEQELLRTQKLESIGTLAGGIAHDFNNLLQGVFGYISLAKLTVESNEKRLAALEQAEKALHLSVNLTSQLLTFSKGGKPVKKPVDLRQTIEDAAKFALSGSRSTYRMDIEKTLWPVLADEGQINQAIQNIVLNANQAMPLGNTIQISAWNEDASKKDVSILLDKDRYVAISVRDTGVGIPEEYLSMVFDPYFTTKDEGSGLGLATAYSIIRNHEGLIDVTSQSGKGSTFTIYMPAAEEPVEDAARAVSSRGRTGKVLVMDDDEVVRNVVGELAAILGHEVELVQDGEAAIAAYQKAKDSGGPFDAVILDLTIRGGMGGIETLKKLKETDPDIRAVVSSGYSDSAAMADNRAYGFIASLRKPYTVEVLREALDEVLSEG